MSESTQIAGLSLTRRVHQFVVAHVRREAPLEAVGILGGHRPGTVTEAFSLANLARPDLFLADPYEQYRAETALRDAGLEFLAVYHSHPGGGTLPSRLDLEFAAKRDIAHIVVALHSGRSAPTELAAYRMRNGQPVALTVTLTD